MCVCVPDRRMEYITTVLCSLQPLSSLWGSRCFGERDLLRMTHSLDASCPKAPTGQLWGADPCWRLCSRRLAGGVCAFCFLYLRVAFDSVLGARCETVPSAQVCAPLPRPLLKG